MSLVDPTYFTNNVNLPAVDTIDNAVIKQSIDQYEPEALKDILGDELYQLYVDDNFSSERFRKLRDGDTFTFDWCGNTIIRKFIGLADPKSLLVYYIYYKIVMDRVTQTTRIGEVVTMSELSRVVTPTMKLVDAWNDYIDLVGLIPNKARYLDRSVRRWNGFDKYDLSNYDHYNDKASLYNYMLANKDIYPEWVYNNENKTKLNVYGF
jgi:hypothetical protein